MTYNPFAGVLHWATEDALISAALVDRNGKTIDLAGAISADEAMPLATLVMHRLKSEDLAARLFAGEILSLALDGREVAVAIAQRQLFVVAVFDAATREVLERVRELRDRVAAMLQSDTPEVAPPTWGGGSGGSGSGPADLALVEYGVTVPKRRGQA